MAIQEIPRVQVGNIPVGMHDRYWLDPALVDYNVLEDAQSHIFERCEGNDLPKRVEFLSLGIRGYTSHRRETSEGLVFDEGVVLWSDKNGESMASSLIRPRNDLEFYIKAGFYGLTNFVNVEMTPHPFQDYELSMFSNLGLVSATMRNHTETN